MRRLPANRVTAAHWRRWGSATAVARHRRSKSNADRYGHSLRPPPVVKEHDHGHPPPPAERRRRRKADGTAKRVVAPPPGEKEASRWNSVAGRTRRASWWGDWTATSAVHLEEKGTPQREPAGRHGGSTAGEGGGERESGAGATVQQTAATATTTHIGHDLLPMASNTASCRRLRTCGRGGASVHGCRQYQPIARQGRWGSSFLSGHKTTASYWPLPALEQTLQRRPQVIFAKRGATWRKRVSLLRKWGRSAPASTSPTPFTIRFNEIKCRKYNAYVAFRNGA